MNIQLRFLSFRHSIIFSAWSALSYDHYTICRWISDNYHFINRNLIAYIDLGNGIIGNSTLNLHGSPLLQQTAQRAADVVVSPLVHNHVCHHRRKQTIMSHMHDYQRRRHDDEHEHHTETNKHEPELQCQPHKLFDEWMRARKNRIGFNKSLSIVQMIDTDSSAALFQLKHGIPSILIEMTDEQALTNDTFYLKKSPVIFNNEIQPEVFVAYTQFVSEFIRQLIDEPLIPFNLTDYANLIDQQTVDYVIHYNKAYHILNTYLGDSDDLMHIINDLTKTIRKIQSYIDQTSKNNHVFTGPALGLTNTVVSLPLLSNILYDIERDPPTKLCDTSKLYWLRSKQHLRYMTRILNGFDGLLSNS